MRLSVIIACFNAADTIAVQLEALATQDWSEPWEVIVSDNGSTDQSRAIIEQYQERLPNLRVVDSSGRRGAAYARNVGVLAATGEAIAFCDADDEVAPGWLAAMGEALSVHDFVTGRCEYEKLNEPWVVKSMYSLPGKGLREYKYPPYLPYAATCNLGLKLSLHKAIGGFDEAILRLEDLDYCWRVQLAGAKLHVVPDAVVHYRLRDKLAGIARISRISGENHVLLYKKYRPLGMPELSWKSGVKEWLVLFKRFPQVRLKEGRARWVRHFNWRLGRLKGCIKHRVLAL